MERNGADGHYPSMRRTKIIATIGPASNTPETVMRLIEAGMDVARLNFSHGTQEEHARNIAMLRDCAAQARRPLALLQDLQGPKIRTGRLVQGRVVLLRPGARFTITTREIDGTAEGVSTTYEDLPRDVQRGDRILISDGLIELQVVETNGHEVQTEVLFGGELREHQGINLPGVRVSSPSLTTKDAEDLAFGLAQGVDYVALSFVRQAADIIDIKERIAVTGKDVPVIAKIEKPEALDDIGGIVKHADAIMVARGDLGVEIPTERVPPTQKMLIHTANDAAVPVITATQMLDSMIRNPRPTRAEASDVANAIFDGSDALMLSGETATGLFPVQSVQMMARIILAAEDSGRYSDHVPDATITPQRDIPHAISAAARAIVEALPIRAIVAFTRSGLTARLISFQRPTVPIMAFTPSEAVYHRMNLFRGVIPFRSQYAESLSKLSRMAFDTLLSRNLIQTGDMIVLMGGYPVAARSSTNFLKVLKVNPMGLVETNITDV